MKKNMWYIFGILLLFCSISFIATGALLDASCKNIVSSPSEAMPMTYLMYNMCSLRSVSYSVPGFVLFSISIGFLICGYLEKN